MNIPTMLTLSRILAIPLLLVCYYLPFDWAHLAAAILFALSAFTDWLDGYLARSLSQSTPLGAFLDPVADKLVVSVAIVMIVSQQYADHLVIPAVIIIGREIAISALREWMSELGKRGSIAVTYLGKIKTTIQMVALTVLLLYTKESPGWLLAVGGALLYVAAALTLWSMINYLKVAWGDLTSSSKG
jgi:CDP-diacylglycerol---glycerol-3-phosphate 3-phosphatidyltransferase